MQRQFGSGVVVAVTTKPSAAAPIRPWPENFHLLKVWSKKLHKKKKPNMTANSQPSDLQHLKILIIANDDEDVRRKKATFTHCLIEPYLFL